MQKSLFTLFLVLGFVFELSVFSLASPPEDDKPCKEIYYKIKTEGSDEQHTIYQLRNSYLIIVGYFVDTIDHKFRHFLESVTYVSKLIDASKHQTSIMFRAYTSSEPDSPRCSLLQWNSASTTGAKFNLILANN